MTRLKIIGAVALLSAAIATPVMAQEVIPGPGSRYVVQPQAGPTYYQNYDEYDAPVVVSPRYNRDDGFFGGYGYRDRSRVGGYSPSDNPAGN